MPPEFSLQATRLGLLMASCLDKAEGAACSHATKQHHNPIYGLVSVLIIQHSFCYGSALPFSQDYAVSGER